MRGEGTEPVTVAGGVYIPMTVRTVAPSNTTHRRAAGGLVSDVAGCTYGQARTELSIDCVKHGAVHDRTVERPVSTTVSVNSAAVGLQTTTIDVFDTASWLPK